MVFCGAKDMQAMAVPSIPRTSHIHSVVRACEILKYLQQCTDDVSLDIVCRHTQMPRPSAYRLLTTLVSCGMVERVSKNCYRPLRAARSKRLRIGYASQTEEFSFSRLVSDSIRSAAYRAGVDLLVLDNHCSPKAAIRNAGIFVRERMDLVIEFQTNHQSASLVAARILEAGIPLIAIEVPHPGATYYGADNYRAGVLGGRALGKACLQEWKGRVDEVVLMELPTAGPLPRSRMTATLAGLREVLPRFPDENAIFLDGKGRFEDSLAAMRKHLGRTRAKKILLAALNDPSCLGALQAFEECGRPQDCLAVGQNASIEARREMRRPNSRLIGSVGYFPEKYGDSIMQLAMDVVEHREVPSATFVKHRLIHAGNVNSAYPNDLEIGSADADSLLYSKR
ncbi:monosaccharide ABC transporter substrate-binding protein, CUT2 family [Terriglobus roseus DSM 18391]|uniref:Monosaccharide ABC transporter substrate-binding protein, CUT2 family n=2 Tax=Terriglobus roseus TaxID=392734 RepID=I3ZIV9_TERRK|nr:monosaccharide ABC transporter substrate-binding protein, CUT2 family [Terriglobus roseus DSM 18391]